MLIRGWRRGNEAIFIRPGEEEDRQSKSQQRDDHRQDHPVRKIGHDDMILARFQRNAAEGDVCRKDVGRPFIAYNCEIDGWRQK